VTAAPRRLKVPGPFRYRELPPDAVYVGRALLGYPRSPFHNPYNQRKTVTVDGETVAVRDRGHAVDLYRRYLARHPELAERARSELAGKDLACWCPLPAPGEEDVCHAAVLLTAANER
jgi:hypothetical protein